MRTLRAAKGELEAHQRRLAELRSRLAGLRALAGAARSSHQEHVMAALRANHQLMADTVRETIPIEARAWDDPGWQSWQPRTGPDLESDATRIRAGHLRDARSGNDLPAVVCLELIGRDRPVLVLSRTPEQQQVAQGLLGSLVVRAAALLPHRARFYLLDPATQGAAFPMARHLGDAVVNTANPAEALDTLLSEIRRINHDYLDAQTPAFHQVPESERRNEPYHLIFAAGYPTFYDYRSTELLQNIAGAGPRAGVYLFVHQHLAAAPDHTDARTRVPGAQVVDLARLEEPYGTGAHEARGDQIPPFPVHIICDREPEPRVEHEILARIVRAGPSRRVLGWEDLGQPDRTRWWRGDATDGITAPIAHQGGGNRTIDLTFGTTPRGQEVAHGLLVAMSGAGKTALLQTLIMGLAVRYSPSELKFLLLDGKVGVEFRPYRDLPHAEIVSLNTRPELARSVLQDLVRELVHRNELFKRAGVNNFPAYRRAGSPDGPVPRLLLVADEYQLLFEDDRDEVASSALQRLSDQGRSAGIHLLLGSQHFAPPHMPHRHDIFANFHLRMVMQMVPSELYSTPDFGREGRRLIGTFCDAPGKVVVSDRPGSDADYQAGSTGYLEPGRRDELVRALREAAGAESGPLVLDGDRQPEVAESGLLPALARGVLRDHPRNRQVFAHEVLGEPDWLLEEHPLALVLGLPFTVRGETFAVLRRRPLEGLALIGTRAPERTAMIASALLSACLQLSPSELELAVADRGVHAGEGVLERTVHAAAGCGYSVSYGRDDATFERILRAGLIEADRRSIIGSVDEPMRLLVLNEPNRVSSLLQQPGRYGAEDSELGAVLRRLMETGPAVGVHLVLAAGTVGELGGVLDASRALSLLRHRVAMQMAESDSLTVVRSNAATRLQRDGPRPIAALLFDLQADRGTKFRPWSLDGLSLHIEEALKFLA